MATLSYADAAKAFQNASAASAQNVPAVSFAHDWQSNNLDPATAQALLKVDQALAGTVPGLTVTSAYRPADYNAQVGGAQGSQHISGKAIDLDLSSFSPQQKQAVLNAVMAQPEIKGIGVYDKNLNTLHFDTRAGDRVAWGPDYTSASLGSVLNGYTQPMLTSWLNGAPTQAPTTTASATPPMPNLRPTGLATAPAPSSAAPTAPTSLASSWLPSSLQQGGSGFADVLGSGMSPLVNARIAESSDVPAGPFGADALVRAAMAGDQAGVQKAMGDVMGAAIGAIFSGKGSKDQITQQINDYLSGLATSAPGAARAIQAASTANPQLFSALAPDQQAQVKAALAALPPQATGQVAMPNLRPSGGPSTPPLVASAPDTAPKMASFTPPSQPLPFDAADNLDVRTTPGTADASPAAYSPPAADAAGLAQLLGHGSLSSVGSLVDKGPGQDFGSFFEPTDSTPPASPWDRMASMSPTGSPSPSAWDQGLPNGPQQYWTPPPPAPDPSQFLSSLTGGYGPATQSTMGPSSMLSSLTGGYGAANPVGGWLVPPTKQVTIGQVPPAPQTRPQPSPLAAALVGPLQDYGSVTPPQTQQMQNLYDAYQNQGDSYIQWNPFSYGQQ